MGFAGMINTYGMDYSPIPYLCTSKTVRLSVFFHMTFWPNRRVEYLQLAWWWKPCFWWLITPLILGLRPTCNWDTTHLETGAFHQVSKSKIPSWAGCVEPSWRAQISSAAPGSLMRDWSSAISFEPRKKRFQAGGSFDQLWGRLYWCILISISKNK